MASPDEFDRITEGHETPDPIRVSAEMAALQVGAFFAGLKRWRIPDSVAEYLTRAYMEIGSDDG